MEMYAKRPKWTIVMVDYIDAKNIRKAKYYFAFATRTKVSLD
jgi:hypothetical protein